MKTKRTNFLTAGLFGLLFVFHGSALAQNTTPKIAVGANQSLVLTDDGTVYTFGDGTYGTAGQGNAGRFDIAAPITHANLGGKKIIASATSNGSADEFTLLIAEDSTVYSFGKNDEGQLGHGDVVARRDPTQITHTNISGKKFVAVAAGNERSYLLASDGLVFAMGLNHNGYLGIGGTSPSQVLVPTLIDTTNLSGHKITQIVTGDDHTLMLSDSNYVFAFGANSNGQYGNGQRAISTLPVQVPKANFGNKTLIDIEAGFLSSMALADDGTVFSWGNRFSGLGHGSLSSDLLTPTALSHANLSGKTITNISKTSETGLLLASDGTVFIFGDLFAFDFGFDLMDFPTEFTSSSTLGKTISDISTGRVHGLLLAGDGTVFGFGEGRDGRNGVGSQATLNSPRLIEDTFTSEKKITQLSAGGNHSILIDSAGVAYSFGGRDAPDISINSTNRHLGRSFYRIVDTPTELSHANLSGETIVDVAAGGRQSFLLTEEGKVFTFGEGLRGALGLEDSVDVYEPTKIEHTNLSGKKITKIATNGNGESGSTGYAHTLMLAEDGSIFAMGNNDAGQLGLGDFVDRKVPTEITHPNLSGKTITNIAVGAKHSMLIASDGSVFIWGRGGNGEMGYGNTDTLSVPILASHISALGKTFIDGAIGFNSGIPHFLLLAADNSVYSFGEGSDGQLGLGVKADNYVPSEITSSNISGKIISNVVAGERTSMLLMEDGSVFSFGNTHRVGIEGNSFADKTEPTLLDNSAIAGKRVTAIAANTDHGLAIIDEGTILSFGSDVSTFNRLGVLGNGLPESGDETPQPIANFNWLSSSIPTTNLALHLDAGRGFTQSGDTISVWANLAGTLDAFEGTVSYRPIRADSAINDQPGVLFDGTDNSLTLPSATDLGITNSDYEVFIVAKSINVNTEIDFLLAGGAEQFEYHLNGSAGGRFIPKTGTFIDQDAIGAYSDTTAHLFNARATSSTAINSVNRNSTTVGVNAHSSYTGDLFLGKRASGVFFFNGYISEVIIYNSVLSAADRGKVERYLFRKYKIKDYSQEQAKLTGTEGWRLMASPVADSTLSPLFANLWTQGFTGASVSHGVSNVYTWSTDNATGDNTNFTALTDIADSPGAGSGALVYVFSDDNGPGVEGDAGFPKTMNIEGLEPSGDRNLTSLLNTNVNGFTLLGNPFKKDVDWDSFTKTNLSNSVYVYDNNSAGWKSWNGTLGSLSDGEIGAFNGFFVQTTGADPTISVPQAAKKDSANQFLGKQLVKANPFYFSIELASDSGYINKAWFQFSESGEFGIDNFDAYKLGSLSPNYVSLASVLDDTIKLDINSLPLIQESLEIPLELNSTEVGTHSFTLKDVNFPESWEVVLYDSETENSSKLQESYTFTIDKSKVKTVKKQNSVSQRGYLTPPSIASILGKGKSKATSNRFSLLITPSMNVSNEPLTDLPTVVELQQNYPNPFNPSTTIAYGVPQTGKVTLEVFDILGRKVATLLNAEQKPAGRYIVNFDASNLASGMYIYRLRAGNSIITKKLTLIK